MKKVVTRQLRKKIKHTSDAELEKISAMIYVEQSERYQREAIASSGSDDYTGPTSYADIRGF